MKNFENARCANCEMRKNHGCKGTTCLSYFKCEAYVNDFAPTAEAIEKAEKIIAERNGLPVKTFK